MLTVEVDPLTEFFDAIKSPLTKDRYKKRLDIFLKYIGAEGIDLKSRARIFESEAKKNHKWATEQINGYMRFQKERAAKGDISESTVPNFYKPIKLFLEINDINLNWKNITRRFPKGRQYGKDRAPSLEEIRSILKYPDSRIKPVILLLLSSGMRIGAFDYLNWEHIIPIEKDGQTLAKVIVYAGTNDQYYTFITPEAYRTVKEYMDYRVKHFEKTKGDSPVIRDLFLPEKGARGVPNEIKRLKSSGVKRLIEDALKKADLRPSLEGKRRRHEFQAAHGFRKFFKTVCEHHMKSLNVEMLMGHNIGLGENYYRPEEEVILEDYLKAVPSLTILDNETRIYEPQEVQSLKSEIKTLNDKVSVFEKRFSQFESFTQRILGITPDDYNLFNEAGFQALEKNQVENMEGEKEYQAELREEMMRKMREQREKEKK